MKFVERDLPEKNVNVSQTHPLKEFIALLGGLVLVILVTTLILGFFITLLLPLVTPKLESKIFGSFVHEIAEQDSLSREDSLVYSIFDSVVAASDCQVPLTLIIKKDPQINAYAVPGGIVVLNEGLLAAVTSENELAFVIGHEIGHFSNRDHLRGLGYSIAFSLVSSVLMKENSDVSNLISAIGTLGTQRYSQHRESEADEYGLTVLNGSYGHCGGATNLFQHFKEDGTPQFLYLFSTHPSPDARISTIKQKISNRGYAEREVTRYDRDGERDDNNSSDSSVTKKTVVE